MAAESDDDYDLVPTAVVSVSMVEALAAMCGVMQREDVEMMKRC